MPDILTVQDCMARVMGDVREVAKTDRNTQQGFNFRGVDAVVNAVAPALRARGVVVVPRLDRIDYVPYTTTKGTSMMCCRVVVTYRFIGPGGDYIEAIVAGESSDAGDKSTPKAMSVAFRTALLQALALPTDDVDPDANSHERTSPAVTETSRPSGAPSLKPPVSSTQSSAEVREAPAATDGGQAALASDDRGEGSSDTAGGGGPSTQTEPPATDKQWADLIDLAGSKGKARELINDANATTYTAATVRFATVDEVAAAMAKGVLA